MNERRETTRRTSDKCMFHVDHENRIAVVEEGHKEIVGMMNKVQRYLIVILLGVIGTLVFAYGRWAAEKVDPPRTAQVQTYETRGGQ